MKNRPGISWGPDHPVNAVQTVLGYAMVDYSGKRPRIVERISKRPGKGLDDWWLYNEAMRRGAALNYGTQKLAPGMAEEMDATP